MRIIFFLLGQKGFIALKRVFQMDPEVKQYLGHVVIGKDAGVVDDYSGQIEDLCKEENVPYFFRGKYSADNHDESCGIAIGWRWLIDTSKMKLIVLHDSLLPKLRGFNPLVTALIEGEPQIGVTAIFANETIDAGPIIEQAKIGVDYPIKIQDAILKIANLYGEILVKVVQRIKENTLSGVVQDENEATYSLWRNEEDYRVIWNDSAERVKRFIDSVGSPYLGACTYYENTLIRINDVEIVPDLAIVNRTPGKILSIEKNQPIVVCGSGLIKIISATDESSKQPHIFSKLRVRLQ